MTTFFNIEADKAAIERLVAGAPGRVNGGIRAGLAAGLAIAERAAIASAPGRTWRDPKGYRKKIRAAGTARMTGRLTAMPPANVLQGGGRAVAAPVSDRHVLAYMLEHNIPTVMPGLSVRDAQGNKHFVPFDANPRFEEWAREHGRYERKYFVFPAKAARPWVVPAAERVEDQITAAVSAKMLEAM